MDEEIVKLIKYRNEKGIELLINEYSPLIKSIVKKHLYNLGQYHEECINDVYLAVWNNIAGFDKDKNILKNWVAAITTYKTIDYIIDNKERFVPNIYANGEKINIDRSRHTDISVHLSNEIENGSSVIISVKAKGLDLIEKENINVVFNNIAIANGVEDNAFSYTFDFDINNYIRESRIVDVNKNINIEGSTLEVDKVIVYPDRIMILGNEDGFHAWNTDENIKYNYHIVDQNNEPVPLKASIREGAFFHKGEKEITSLSIIPYTFDEIDTKITNINHEGKTMYIIEDKIMRIDINS